MGRAHPWLAGFYYGVVMGLFYTAWIVICGGTSMLYVAVLGGLASWPLFAVGVKLRWGQRPNAKAYPPPTYRRMWSRASDAYLLWFMWLGIVAVIFIVPPLLTGTAQTAFGVITLVVALDITVSTWMERRRRKRPD